MGTAFFAGFSAFYLQAWRSLSGFSSFTSPSPWNAVPSWYPFKPICKLVVYSLVIQLSLSLGRYSCDWDTWDLHIWNLVCLIPPQLTPFSGRASDENDIDNNCSEFGQCPQDIRTYAGNWKDIKRAGCSWRGPKFGPLNLWSVSHRYL